MKIRSTLLGLILTCLPLTSFALTTGEIEVAWSKVSNLSGTFVQTNDDGSTSRGTFTVQDPTQMSMVYRNGATMDIKSGRYTVTDVSGEPVVGSLGPFGRMFRTTPDFGNTVSGTGQSEHYTTIRLRHPVDIQAGYVDVTFSNKSGLMARWIANVHGSTTTTTFSY